MLDTDKPNGKAIVPRLRHGSILPESSVTRRLHVTVPSGTDPDTVMEPSYWMHHARMLQPMDILVVFCEDGTWENELRVQFVSRDGVKVSPRWQKPAEHGEYAPDEAETSVHTVKWRGPKAKWGVMRLADGAIVRDGFYPKDQAISYLKSLGG